MFAYACVILLALLHISANIPITLAIIGGAETTIEAHPYAVSLQNYQGEHLCGGSIITEDVIVTTASCLRRERLLPLWARLGSTHYLRDGERVQVKSFKYHEQYNVHDFVYDVGVLKLTTPVQQSTKLRFIPLALLTPQHGTAATVSGWGTTSANGSHMTPSALHALEMRIIGALECASKPYKYGKEIRESMICASAAQGRGDSCSGDEGAALVADGQLVGIVSWGHGCDEIEYPGVYCDVASVRSWIVNAVNDL